MIAKYLVHADRLRIIGHAAGSVKKLTPPEVLRKGIKVTSAAATIAEGVGEANLASILMMLRNLHRMDIVMKTDGDWAKARKIRCRELRGKKVGIIAASRTGRNLIRLLKPFPCEIVVYDPYLSKKAAAEIGVTKVDLDELMAKSDVISVHAPITPETHHMIGPRQLSLIKPGVVFTSTARSWVVDPEALLKELRTGRFDAALDVFDTEPLPPDNPFRELNNVALTPHMAGNAVETRGRLGGTIVDEFKRFFTGIQLEYEVTEQLLEVMA